MSIHPPSRLRLSAALAALPVLGLCAAHSLPRAQAQRAAPAPVQSLTDQVAAMQKQIDALQAQSVRDRAAAARSQQMDYLRYNALAENLAQMQKQNNALADQVQLLQAERRPLIIQQVPSIPGSGTSRLYPNPLYPEPNPLFQAPPPPPRPNLGTRLPWTLLGQGPH